MKLGYACINVSLQNQKPKVTTGRTIRRSGFDTKGIRACSEIALQNIKDLFKIIVWNKNNGIEFYRMSSDIIPWASEYDLKELPHYNEIKEWLEKIGKYAKENGQRLTYHPGPYNVLSSPNDAVVVKTIKDLEHHSEIMDLLGLSHSPYNKINIHIGGVYGDRVESAKRFCKNFERLSENCKSRLTIENDDSANKMSVADLYQYIFADIGIPIVFDYHHHSFNTGDLSEEDALELAIATWPEGITPIVHYSESKALHENNSKIRAQAHSDYINGPINTYGYDVDVMIEAKQKELALVKYKIIS
jgi:UV DNA damage endonuclease